MTLRNWKKPKPRTKVLLAVWSKRPAPRKSAPFIVDAAAMGCFKACPCTVATTIHGQEIIAMMHVQSFCSIFQCLVTSKIKRWFIC
jgi:hypothetical protein